MHGCLVFAQAFETVMPILWCACIYSLMWTTVLIVGTRRFQQRPSWFGLGVEGMKAHDEKNERPERVFVLVLVVLFSVTCPLHLYAYWPTVQQFSAGFIFFLAILGTLFGLFHGVLFSRPPLDAAQYYKEDRREHALYRHPIVFFLLTPMLGGGGAVLIVLFCAKGYHIAGRESMVASIWLSGIAAAVSFGVACLILRWKNRGEKTVIPDNEI
jgi:hypothetical protein